MKKTAFILSIAVALTACQQEELVQQEVIASPGTFVASVEDYSGATKTLLNECNSVIWSQNDRLSIFNGSSANDCYQLKNEYIGEQSGVFSLVSEKVESDNEEQLVGNLAIYPYQEDLVAYQIFDEADEPIGLGVENFEIPIIQTYQENSFANGSFPMIATTKDKDDHNLKFRNIAGVLKVELFGDITVSSIQLRSRYGEGISGTFSIETLYDNMIPTMKGISTTNYIELDCDEGIQLNKTTPTAFYFAVPPTVFQLGFTIRVRATDGFTYTKIASNEQTIERSTILSMPPYMTGAMLSLSTDFVSLPSDGSPVEISLTATEDWSVSYMPSWVKVTPSSGTEGTTNVSISMVSDSEAYNRNNTHIDFESYDWKNIVTILKDRPVTTCANVIENGIEDEEYRVSGYVKDILNTSYGNWYLEDETGELYIYGTTRGGNYIFNLEIGDFVTLQGPKKTYYSTVELVDATIISVQRTLVKLISIDNQPIPYEGGEFKVMIECPEDNIDVIIPEDAQSWISVSKCERIDEYCLEITFTATENTNIDRTSTITFELLKDGHKSYTKANVHQSGQDIINKVTIQEYYEAPVNSYQKYELTGTIEEIVNETYGNFYLKDETGSVYVYGLTTLGEIGSNDKSFSSIGLKVGDTLTLVGLRGEYKGTVQVTGAAYYVSHISN